jgi:hypothetical protein
VFTMAARSWAPASPSCRRAWNAFRPFPSSLVPRYAPPNRASAVASTWAQSQQRGRVRHRRTFSDARPEWGHVPASTTPLDVAVRVTRRSQAAKGSHFDNTPPVVKLVRTHTLSPLRRYSTTASTATVHRLSIPPLNL